MKISGKCMEPEIIIMSNTDSEKQILPGFLSFMDGSFESLDLYIPPGVPAEVRKLLRSHERWISKEGKKKTEFSGVKG